MAGGGDSSPSSVVALVSKFLTPTAWIAGIIGLVGLAGLAFNTFLSLLVGARIANYSSTGEHFGSGAGLFFPGIVYTLDLLVAGLYILLVLILVWLLLVLVIKLAFAAVYWFLRLLVWASRERQKKGMQPWLDETKVKKTADDLKNGTPFVLDWSLGMLTTTRTSLSWTRRRLAWIFTFTFLVAIAFFLTLWVPYSEANRYKFELGEAAEASLKCAGRLHGEHCGQPPGSEQASEAPSAGTTGGDAEESPTTPVEEKMAADTAVGAARKGPGADRLFCALDAAAGNAQELTLLEPASTTTTPASTQPPPEGEPAAGTSVAEERQFRTPVLTYLAVRPGRLFGKEAWLGQAFGWGAQQLSCGVNLVQGWIPLDALLAKPKLVAVGFGGKDEVLRPMLTVAEYGDAVILYDFLFDPQYGDKFLYPLRALKQSNVRNVTAIDPTKGLPDAGFPILSVLDAACGRSPLEPGKIPDEILPRIAELEKKAPLEGLSEDERKELEALNKTKELEELKETIYNECTGNDPLTVQACIKREFVKIDTLSCRANELPETMAAKPGPSSPPEPLVAALADLAATNKALAESLAKLPPVKGDGSILVSIRDDVAAIKQRLDRDPSGDLVSRLVGVDKAVAAIATRLDQARLNELAPGIGRVETNVSNVLTELDRHDGKLEAMKLGELAPAIAALSKKLEDARTDLAGAINGGRTEVTTTLSAIRTDLAVLATNVGEIGKANEQIPGIASNVEQALRAIADLDRKLGQAEAVLKAAVENGVNVRYVGDGAPSPGRPPAPSSGFYVFSQPDESVAIAEPGKCTPLSRWNESAYAIEFENNKYRVQSDRRHDLVTTDGADPWDRLTQAFADWTSMIEGLRADQPAGASVVVMLTGRASEDGAVGHNLDLSRKRAEEVAEALNQFWEDNGAAPYRTVAVGRGEFDRQIGATSTTGSPTEARRVDAAACIRADNASTAAQ